MIRGVALVAVVTLMFGCVSKQRAAYQRIADEVNPILVTLIPKVAVIQALGPSAADDDPRLAAAWAAAEPELARLHVINADDSTIEHGIPGIAGQVMFDRQGMCWWSTKGATRPAGTCRSACLGGWAVLTQAVRELRVSAKAEGVLVLSLPIVDPPSARD